MILALLCGCVSHAAWPDDDMASSGMLRQRDRRGVISLGLWMTASDAGDGGGGGGGAWLLATTKELANRTHVPYFFARTPRSRHSHPIARIPSRDQQTRRVRARQRIANVCEHRIECWIHSDFLANKMLREWMNDWMNEWMNIALFFFSPWSTPLVRWNFAPRGELRCKYCKICK